MQLISNKRNQLIIGIYRCAAAPRASSGGGGVIC